jgi:FkbM family methyltransferase
MKTTENFPARRTTSVPPAPRAWRQTLRYVTRFGIRGGLQAARVRGGASHPVPLRLPELPHPLWVRPGTSDAATFDEVFVAREYDLPLADFSPRQVLDLGANVGFASVLFSARWPEAKVLSVEPERENMILLKRNTAPYRNIEALHAAVWSRETEVAVANPAGDANAFRMTENAAPESATIPAFTVNQLLDRLGGKEIDLVKMDVEGAEREILEGAGDWLDRVNVLVIELHDRIVPGCSEALYRAMQGRALCQEIVGQNLVIDLRAALHPRAAGAASRRD